MIQLITGNSLRIPLADESVHCVVTSPPYWSLRDYGTAKWVGGVEGWSDGAAKQDGAAINDLPLWAGDIIAETKG